MWLADGTFSTAPHQFMQLYSIHGLYHGSVYPFVYMFMTKRTQAMYSALLASLVKTAADRFNIVLQPTNISTDFEKAAINALEEVFTTAVVTGCHFHLGQSVIRKVNELGLKNTYQRDKDFALKARMLYGLAYLPVQPEKFHLGLIMI